jgi:hypothetical protein
MRLVCLFFLGDLAPQIPWCASDFGGFEEKGLSLWFTA